MGDLLMCASSMRSNLRAARLLLTLILAASAIPAFAARKMSIEQLQQAVAAAQTAHRGDDALAQQLGEAKLTARLDSATLQSLLAQSPGPHSTRALRALYDDSAFLDPPPSEIPDKPAPTVAAQKAMLGQTVNYVARTLPKLPDFMATRVSEHYNDSPRPGQTEGPAVVDGLYLAGIFHTPIAFHDGQESDDPNLLLKASDSAKKNAKPKSAADERAPRNGMSSWGEFGPVLGIVLIDAAKGKLSWARWEMDNGKPVAVYQFSVDRSVSHYNVRYCCVTSSEVINGHYASIGSRGTRENASAGIVQTAPTTPISAISAYHGHLSINPETGVILRITIEADLQPEDPIQRAAMMVEYGPVTIGESTYYCPIRSVALSTAQQVFQPTPSAAIQTVLRRYLNDVQFTGYHRFGSESTLITELGPDSAHGSEAQPDQPVTGSAASPAAAESSPASASPASAPASSTAEIAPPPPPPTPVAEEEKEVAIHPVENLPGITADPNPISASTDKGAFTLNVTTRLVDVSLVATDKHGKPITDLKPEEIEIYDNGRKQQVRQFQQPNTAVAGAAPPPSTDTFTNAQPAVTAENAPDLLILLLDESHLPFQDLNRARGEVLRFLRASRPATRIALYSIGEHGFHVIEEVTQDHALVAAKLAAWTPAASAVSQAEQLEVRNRQQFDTVRNPDDLAYVNGGTNTTPDYIQPSDPQLLLQGDNPLRGALESIIALARHFASVPGHKSLVWISGDSALVDWEDRAVNMEKGDRLPTSGLAHTREVLNEARISLYAVDASPSTQNGGAAVDASLANPNVQLSAVSAANSAPGGAGGPHGSAMGAGRDLSVMQQNTRAVQGPVRQLAESTGGQAVNRGSDLEKTLDVIEQHAGATYQLGFDPDTAADNKYHTLMLKIPTRKDVKLSYRTGYLYNEGAASTRQRFQQAIWSPQDLNAIELTAEPIPASQSTSGKPTVKLRIGFPTLALTNTAGRWTDDLYIFVAVRDDATQKAQVSGETLRLSLKEASYASGMPTGIPYQRIIENASKLGSIRIIVVDANSGRMGSVTLPASALN